jgi:hypothetical protein
MQEGAPLTPDGEMSSLWERFARLKQWVDSWSTPSSSTPAFQPLPLPPHLQDTSPTPEGSLTPPGPKDSRDYSRKRSHPSQSLSAVPRHEDGRRDQHLRRGAPENAHRQVMLRPQDDTDYGLVRHLHGIPYSTFRRQRTSRSWAGNASADKAGRSAIQGKRHVSIRTRGPLLETSRTKAQVNRQGFDSDSCHIHVAVSERRHWEELLFFSVRVCTDLP